LAPRFGIAEWYGKSFVRLTQAERTALAHVALGHDRRAVPLCPFKNALGTEKCTKKGGVCSLRLYESCARGVAAAVTGDDGDMRAVYQEHLAHSVKYERKEQVGNK
jgi:hypothetical protein